MSPKSTHDEIAKSFNMTKEMIRTTIQQNGGENLDWTTSWFNKNLKALCELLTQVLATSQASHDNDGVHTGDAFLQQLDQKIASIALDEEFKAKWDNIVHSAIRASTQSEVISIGSTNSESSDLADNDEDPPTQPPPAPRSLRSTAAKLPGRQLQKPDTQVEVLIDVKRKKRPAAPDNEIDLPRKNARFSDDSNPPPSTKASIPRDPTPGPSKVAGPKSGPSKVAGPKSGPASELSPNLAAILSSISTISSIRADVRTIRANVNQNLDLILTKVDEAEQTVFKLLK